MLDSEAAPVAGSAELAGACAPPPLAEIFGRYKEQLDRCRRALAQSAPAALGDAVAREMAGLLCRGKLLRGLIVHLAGAGDGCPAMLDTAAHAIELLHGASLIHDDIVDNTPHRRGVPALHTQLGPEVALVLGDYLLVRAYAVLGGMGDLAADAVGLVSRYAQRCCLGQARELLLQEPTESAYISTASAKTGAVFAAAAELGVLAAHGTTARRAAAQRYGESLGVAYQIGDDVADLPQDAAAIASAPPVARLAGQRATLPLIYLAEGGNHLGEGGNVPLTGAVDAPEWERVLGRLRDTQRSYINAAVESLAAFEASYEVRALAALARFAAFDRAEFGLGKEMGQEVAKPAR